MNASARSALRDVSATGRSVDPSRGYFPRAVFFFGLGFLVLPVLAGVASFFGRFVTPAPSLLGWPYFSACACALGWVGHGGGAPGMNGDLKIYPKSGSSSRCWRT